MVQNFNMITLYVACFQVARLLLERCVTTKGHYYTLTWQRKNRAVKCIVVASCPSLWIVFLYGRFRFQRNFWIAEHRRGVNGWYRPDFVSFNLSTKLATFMEPCPWIFCDIRNLERITYSLYKGVPLTARPNWKAIGYLQFRHSETLT